MINPTIYTGHDAYPQSLDAENGVTNPVTRALAGVAIQACQSAAEELTVKSGHGFVVDGYEHPTATAAAEAALQIVNDIHDSND